MDQPGRSTDPGALRIAVIGAGISGILAAIKLRQAGHDHVVVYEKANRLGGTWRENTYPGVACDVPAHVYSYSFALNPDWSRKFVPGAEILNYLESVAARYDVPAMIRFGDEVTDLRFEDGRWSLRTAAGHSTRADVVIAATGVLHHPNMPAIAGLNDFAGQSFHSARWDHNAQVEGKRIGVIGTSSTAVQIVSAVGPTAGHLTLFQRTPQWMLPLDNDVYAAELREQFREAPENVEAERAKLSRRFAGSISDAVIDAGSELMKRLEHACRENLDNNVSDPDLRERLRPDYRPACKRLVFANDFYDVVQLPHVELVTEAIGRVEPEGVRTADGALHEVDVLVLATGFQVDRFLRPIEVTGRNDIRLADVWSDRPSAYLAVSVPEFPNLFMLNGPTGPVGNFSLIEVAELQMGYITQLIDHVSAGWCRGISASADATARYNAERVQAAANTIWATGCTSWYLDDRGIPTVWPWTFQQFREAMDKPRLDDFDVVV